MELEYSILKCNWFVLQCRTPERPRICSATKFIIYKECLAVLVEHCPSCGRSCTVSWHVMGKLFAATQLCSCCKFSRRWTSQPMVKDIPAGNIHLSAAIYFSGASWKYSPVCSHILFRCLICQNNKSLQCIPYRVHK